MNMLELFYEGLVRDGKLEKLPALKSDYQEIFYDRNRESINDSKEDFFKDWDIFLLNKLQSTEVFTVNVIDKKANVFGFGAIYDTKAKYNKFATTLFERYGIEPVKTLLYINGNSADTQNQNASPSEMFISHELERYSIEYDARGILVGKLFNSDVAPVKYDELLTKIYTDADYEISINDVPLKRDFIKDHLNNKLSELVEAKKHAIKQVLRYTASNPAIVDQMARAILRYAKVNPTVENIEMCKHLCWSLKRKLYNRNIPFAVFFSFFSKAMGVGKSWFIQNILCAPFSDLVNTDAKLYQLLSDNERKALINGYIACDFQELTIPDQYMKPDGSVAESVINTLKVSITGDYYNGRQLYTDKSTKMYNSVVYMTSTNKHIYNVVRDENGMRRYWEFNWGVKTAGELDLELSKKIMANMVEFYQNLNEDDEIGYYHPTNPAYESILEVQQTYRFIPLIEQFCNEVGIQLHEGHVDGCEVMTKQSFFETHFKDWCEDEGRSWTLGGMTKAIRDRYDINPMPHQLGSSNKPCYFYTQTGNHNRSNLQSKPATALDMIASIKEKSQIRLEIAEPAPISDDMSWAD